jgi:hypothetical protein
MPSSLVKELKILTEQNHFLDTSEFIRSLLRDKWLEQKDPAALKKYRVKKQLKKIAEPEQITALKKTLKILEDIDEL